MFLVKRLRKSKRKCGLGEMAGVAESVQVVSSDAKGAIATATPFDGELSPTDLTFSLSADTSLQELIDSELALRLTAVEPEAEQELPSPEEVSPPEPVRVRPVQPVSLTLDADPSESLIAAERLHTATTLNVFSTTIDLSPDRDLPSPLFPRSPLEDFAPASTFSDPFRDDSPGEPLAPMPLFTQTVSSDHEQSPLTEEPPGGPLIREEVLVVVDPPDDPTPDSLTSPEPASEELSDSAIEDLPVADPAGDSLEAAVDPKHSSVDSIESPLEPSVPELELVDTPLEPSRPESEPTKSPTEPTPPEVETTKFPTEPTETLVDLSQAAVEPTEPSANLSQAALEPTEPLVDLSQPAAEQTEPLLQLIETERRPVETPVPDQTSPSPVASPRASACVDVVDNSVANSMREFVACEPIAAKPAPAWGDEWTTVAEAVQETAMEVSVEVSKEVPKEESRSPEGRLQSTAVAAKPLHVASEPESESDLDSNVSETTTTTTKTVKKKKSTEGGDSTSTKTKKTKKSKKTEEKENHISVKSSFSKFDQLQKKSVLHVRSSDASKIQKQLNQEAPETQGANPTCKSCGKTVFAMEQVKAERSVWHKNCFRCKECSKQLTVDIYQSHEGELYCKPHFRELFKPKAVLDNGDDEPSSDKADLGLEELSSLNVKSKFQVFEKSATETEVERSPSTVNVKRSSSILSKLVKFQKKGMDIGVSHDELNGADYEESSSSEDEEQPTEEDGSVVKSSKKTEKPISFNKMEDVKKTWETSGSTKSKEELRAEHKKEISQIRSRLFQGKQGKMKEAYEQAVAESEGKVCKKDQDIVQSEKARLLRERFERGEITHSDEEEEKSKNKDSEDMSVFEAGISKKSRSIFLELDATAAKTQTSPVTPPVHALTPRTTERRTSQTEDSPDREIYRDPAVVRSEDTVEDETIVKRSQTASKMLSLFRQMEEQKEAVPDGPKPLKCFTPPPDHKEDSGSSEEEGDEEDESEEEEESEDDTGIVKASHKIEDEFLKQARNAARSKALKEKFEHWEPEKQSVNNAINLLDSEQESIESTKSLRARFESLKAEQPKEKPRPKVNRFVMQETVTTPNKCVSCEKTVYPLEKIEVNGKLYHALCFKCQQCNCKLRMDTYTLNNEMLYCLTHFRQLFISKGNYDEGFGNNQHKRKWESGTSPVSPASPTSLTPPVPATTVTNGHH